MSADSAVIGSILVKRTVGIGDIEVSANAEDELITHALGSCIGVTVHDARAGVGGMIHIMLPASKLDMKKARRNPGVFVDTGIPELFNMAYSMGATKESITVKVAGGAQILDTAETFKIGLRNYTMLRKMLWKNRVMIDGEDVGGDVSRTMTLQVGTGVVTIRSNGIEREL